MTVVTDGWSTFGHLFPNLDEALAQPPGAGDEFQALSWRNREVCRRTRCNSPWRLRVPSSLPVLVHQLCDGQRSASAWAASPEVGSSLPVHRVSSDTPCLAPRHEILSESSADSRRDAAVP